MGTRSVVNRLTHRRHQALASLMLQSRSPRPGSGADRQQHGTLSASHVGGWNSGSAINFQGQFHPFPEEVQREEVELSCACHLDSSKPFWLAVFGGPSTPQKQGTAGHV